MKKITKIIMCLMVITCLQFVISKTVYASQFGSQFGINSVKPTNIKITNNPGTIKTGDSYTLKAEISPSNASDKTVTWSVDNKELATINKNGVLKGKGVGTVKVTAKTVNGKTDSIAVTIKTSNRTAGKGSNSSGKSTVDVTGIKITGSKDAILVGDKLSLKAEVSPSNASNKTVTWSVDKSNVASIDKNGVLTGKSEGTVKVTAKSVNGKTKSIEVTVKKSNKTSNEGSKSSSKTNINVTDIKITGSKDVLLVDRNLDLKAEVLPSNATNKTIKWSSSDSSIANVDKNGKVKANKVGVATITATAKNGIKKSVTINVISVKLSEENIKTSENESYKVTATINIPKSQDIYNKIADNIEWKNANSSIMNLTNPQKNDDIENGTLIREITVNGKNEGITTLMLNIYNSQAAYSVVEIQKIGSDYSIPCPEIKYEQIDNYNIAFTIKGNEKISKYKLQYSKNYTSGKNAKWNEVSEDYEGEKRFETSINSAQAKITVYSKTGTSRICYTAPFNFSNNIIGKNPNLKCPKLTTNEKLVEGAKSYTLNLYGFPLHTGVSNVDITVSPYNNNQYTWYMNEDRQTSAPNRWLVDSTYSETNNFTIETSSDNYHDKQARIIVIDNSGDINYCYTDMYDQLDFERKEEDVGGPNIYFEKGSLRPDALTEFIKNVPSKYKTATANIIYLNGDTYKKYVGWGQGMAIYASVFIKNNGKSNYVRNAVLHEMGHNLDYMYEKIDVSKERLKKKSDVKSLFESYKNKKNDDSKICDGYKYLREYSYKDLDNFWADLVMYSYLNEFYPNDPKKDNCNVDNILDGLEKTYLKSIEKNQIKYDEERNKYK